MGWFTYDCPVHGNFKVSLPKREKVQHCTTCGNDSKVILKVGSVSIVERLDNGAMARSVERLHNIEEIISDRADKHSSESGFEGE